ncbi:MAG: hypothetical protein N2117_14710 [Anaerolineales bacterium]|nr:hypothetical protein [Anaerolineales bacterium]MCX7756476.1 hypothetical protein [Anaerolineales bacterium]MDW8278349.1 hypothetical protein [Anaerolineales bacterium]
MKRYLLLLSLLLLALLSACANPSQGDNPQPAYPNAYPSYPSGSGKPVQTYLPPAQPADPDNPYAPLPADANLQTGPVYLDDYELQPVSNLPPEYTLALRGSLPTPCHALRVRVNVSQEQNRLDVEVYSVSDPNAICTQVLQSFDAQVPIKNLIPGRYTVWLNGEKIGEIDG